MILFSNLFYFSLNWIFILSILIFSIRKDGITEFERIYTYRVILELAYKKIHVYQAPRATLLKTDLNDFTAHTKLIELFLIKRWSIKHIRYEKAHKLNNNDNYKFYKIIILNLGK